MAFNGAGDRDTGRTLKVGINTVIRTLKNSPRRITSSPVAYADVALICGLNEQWRSVGCQAKQHCSNTCITRKSVVYCPTFLAQEPMKPAANYWHSSRLLTLA